MISEGTSTDVEDIRRRLKLMGLVCIGGDLIVVAVLWLVDFLPQDLLVIITVFVLAGGTMVLYLFLNVLPDRIAQGKGLG